jgi:succinoglycan biosynthesis transport protein ExoP
MALWRAIRRGFKGLLLAAGAAGALTYGAQSLIAPRFTSESQLEFVAKRSNPLPEPDRPAGPDSAARLDQAAINTHVRALLASDLLLRVAADLKLRTRPEFNGALGPVDTWSSLLRLAGMGVPPAGESEEERVLSVVRRQLVVSSAKETRAIAISFSATDSRLAADFANALADTYRAGLVTQPIDETTKAVAALLPKVEQLRREVLEAEADVERFRAASGQFKAGPQSTPVDEQRMAGLQDELLKAEAARNEADARWRTARELLQSGSAEVLPDVQKSPTIQHLIQSRVRLERQIAETSASLLPGHPRMQQLNADVAGLRRQITAEVQKVVQSIEKDARSAAIRVDSVGRQIEQLKSKVVASSNTGNEARLKEFDSIARSKRTELERLQKQLEDNRTVVNIRQVPIEAQVISRALPSSTPTSPRKGPSAILASAATFILGLALIVTRALVSTPAIVVAPPATTTVPAGPSPGPRGGGAPEPGFAPLRVASPGHPSTSPSVLNVSAGPAASAAPLAAGTPLDGLAHRLVTRTDITAGARTLVTADTAGIEPTQRAMDLAEALSRRGKQVVVIQWSLGPRSGVTKPGICDLLSGTAGFEQVIGRVPGSAVHLILPGRMTADSSQLLDSDRLNLTLDALDEAYDQVVVAAGHDDAQNLFEAIEGRFDAAVVVSAEPSLPLPSTETSVLLGYEVAGIDIVYVAPSVAGTAPALARVRAFGRSARQPAA